MNNIRKECGLTKYSTSCGCAAKLSPFGLSDMLKNLETQKNPNLLVGYENADDAAVYKFSEQTSLVFTVDVNSPPVDDPFISGQIIASNALSDVYAMGAKPILCLNIVSFPEYLESSIPRIIEGAISKIEESGATLAGGHTVYDEEPKFGLSVIGTVDSEKFWENRNAKVGDHLILTKPIGNGIYFSAKKQNKKICEKKFHDCLSYSVMLNKTACEVASNFNVHTATDITGFGLLGHTMEIAKASNITCELNTSNIPIFKDSMSLYEDGITTNITSLNLDMVKPYVKMKDDIKYSLLQVLSDPQTNGGLLLFVSEYDSEKLLSSLYRNGLYDSKVIGKVTEYNEKNIVLY